MPLTDISDCQVFERTTEIKQKLYVVNKMSTYMDLFGLHDNIGSWIPVSKLGESYFVTRTTQLGKNSMRIVIEDIMRNKEIIINVKSNTKMNFNIDNKFLILAQEWSSRYSNIPFNVYVYQKAK